MFVKPKDKPWLADAVVAVEAKIKFHPQFDKGPNGEVQIMYVNSKTGTSFGTCPMKEHLFSDATRKALIAFLSSAEADFAQIMFEAGPSEGRADTGAAESSEPLAGLGDT